MSRPESLHSEREYGILFTNFYYLTNKRVNSYHEGTNGKEKALEPSKSVIKISSVLKMENALYVGISNKMLKNSLNITGEKKVNRALFITTC